MLKLKKNIDNTELEKEITYNFDDSYLKNTRNLTLQEISILEKNRNISQISDWSNIRVPLEDNTFIPYLIRYC